MTDNECRFLFEMTENGKNEGIYFADGIRPGQDELYGVLVNNGNASWVFFGRNEDAKQFALYLLDMGISSLHQIWQ